MKNWIIKTFENPEQDLEARKYLDLVFDNHFPEFYPDLPKDRANERPQYFLISVIDLLEDNDSEGNLVALVYGHSMWDWIYIHTLWVHEDHREEGVGAELLKEIHLLASERNCIGIHLETATKKNVEFYQKNGFQIYGALEDHPKGHIRYSLSKKV